MYAFEEDLKLGLRNMWYPICRADAVSDRPLGLRRLGHDIVVWRDSKNRIHVHDDRCLHRGAKLSLGTIVNDTLREPAADFRYIVLESGAVQPFFIIDQDLLAGSGRAMQAFARAVRRIWRRFAHWGAWEFKKGTWRCMRAAWR